MMKVAYIFRNDMSATFQLATMILPQLEQDNHGVEVVGMMFFDDNVYSLSAENEIGKRLSVVANRKSILLMICDQCALRRGMASGDFSQCGSGEVKAKILLTESSLVAFRSCTVHSPAICLIR